MKLYTEEEVKRAIYLAHCNTEEEVLAGLTPIELPTDDEIDQIALDFAKKYRATTYEISALIIGAKYMREKIKGGNK